MISSIGGSAYNIQTLYSKIDKNADSKLSLDEFKAGAPDDAKAPEGAPSLDEIFAQNDTDGDGFLSQEEFAAGAPQGPPPGGPPPGGPPPGGALSGANIAQLSEDDSEEDPIQALLDALNNVTSGDENEDDSSVSETDSTNDLFSFFDQDQDGSISKEELASGFETIRSEMMNYLISGQNDLSRNGFVS